MIHPDISLSEFVLKLKGLEPREVECECGNKGMTTLPIISQDWVGLAMPECSRCGHECPGVIMKSRNPKIQAEMNRFLNGIITGK